MLKDMFHSENPTKMDRAALLRYIYFTASEYGWEYPDMDEYEQRANVGKACQNSRPIGKNNEEVEKQGRHPAPARH
eukprot:COSAG02_NODE_889_length_16164_cov_6.498350_1_plen_76_part_00